MRPWSASDNSLNEDPHTWRCGFFVFIDREGTKPAGAGDRPPKAPRLLGPEERQKGEGRGPLSYIIADTRAGEQLLPGPGVFRYHQGSQSSPPLASSTSRAPQSISAASARVRVSLRARAPSGVVSSTPTVSRFTADW